jgi:hypothetical protein
MVIEPGQETEVQSARGGRAAHAPPRVRSGRSAMLALPAAAATRPSSTTTAPTGTSPRAPAERASARARATNCRSASPPSTEVLGGRVADAGLRHRRPPCATSSRLRFTATGRAGLPSPVLHRRRLLPALLPSDSLITMVSAMSFTVRPVARYLFTCLQLTAPGPDADVQEQRRPDHDAASCVSLLALARRRHVLRKLLDALYQRVLRKEVTVRLARAPHSAHNAGHLCGQRRRKQGCARRWWGGPGRFGRPGTGSRPMLERIEVVGEPVATVRLHLSQPASALARSLPASADAPARVCLISRTLHRAQGADHRPERAPSSACGAVTISTRRVVLDLTHATPFAVASGRMIVVELGSRLLCRRSPRTTPRRRRVPLPSPRPGSPHPGLAPARLRPRARRSPPSSTRPPRRRPRLRRA